MTTSDNRAKFAAFINTKEVAGWLLEFKVESTKATYSSALFRYWNESLCKKYPTLWDWIVEVKAQRKSDDNDDPERLGLRRSQLHEDAKRVERSPHGDGLPRSFSAPR
ncbi:MAG: hypothetical protein AUI93_03680 [Crenarchaeota archaeon 13_1_40CM_3_52_10]|nr:MAG: hypothetical protein AUI93_03680 [Crenarchaeota archaeon 13_1_40CM_3_52_10]